MTMTIYDILHLNKGLLTALSENGVTTKDIEYTEVYEDFQQMKAEGDKINYIVATLADRYGIGERTVWRVVNRFDRPFVFTTLQTS